VRGNYQREFVTRKNRGKKGKGSETIVGRRELVQENHCGKKKDTDEGKLEASPATA